MEWWQFALLGASGGALFELLTIFNSLATWQAARRTSTGQVRKNAVGVRRYLDVAAHLWLLPIRGCLGAVASGLFGATGQITGAAAGVALGFAAPTVLAQLGKMHQVRAMITDDHAEPKPDDPAIGGAGPRELEVGDARSDH